MPSKYDITDQWRGDTFAGLTVTVKDSTSTVIDLTGATVRMDFRFQSRVGTLALQLTNGAWLTISDPTGGVIEVGGFQLSIPVGTYYYDLQLQLASGDVFTALYGTFSVVQDVTT